jgi:hypothetical protein
VIEIELHTRSEVERELAALGAEPEAIFAAEHVHVRVAPS